MTVILLVFGAALVLEFVMQFVRFGWKGRKVIAAVCLLVTAFASGAIALWRPNMWSVLIGIIGLYRVFNYLRIVEGRMHEKYLHRATQRSGLMLLLFQAIAAGGWLAWDRWHVAGKTLWVVAAALQLIVAAVLLLSIDRRLRRTAWLSAAQSDAPLPTVTVAIPARNETEDLQACLASIIASNYPKLEIIVLDDCSQLRQTPDIIRSFAHDGVRFIQGTEPNPTWLPKNQAYNRLAEEASGDYILFCGVDVRFGPDSITQLVHLLQRKKKDMVSVLPWRSDAVRPRLALTQAMRYFWELVPPRRLFQRPPVLSTCWIIRKDSLQKSGGFVAVARAITPEAFFARKLISSDGYGFVRAGKRVQIESVKTPRDQRETAVRTRYPQLHRRPENVLLLTLAALFFMLLPPVLAIGGFWLDIGAIAQVLAAIATLLLAATFTLLVLMTRTASWWFAFIGMPVGVLYDIGLLYYSMWQYEFSVVDWKGRNVCIPTMHVIPHLPELK